MAKWTGKVEETQPTQERKHQEERIGGRLEETIKAIRKMLWVVFFLALALIGAVITIIAESGSSAVLWIALGCGAGAFFISGTVLWRGR